MYKKIWRIIAILGVICMITAGCKGKSEKGDLKTPLEEMTFSFITVGKGDAFLLEIPHQGYYMFDTGKKEDWEQIKAVLQKKSVRELKGLFLSHGHKDHVGNMEKILQEFPVEAVYISGKDTVSYKEVDVYDIAKKAGVTVKKMQGGESLLLGKARIGVWIPKNEDKRNENNNSMVLRIVYGNTEILLTGDMEMEEEAQYLAENIKIQADILKLGHHGETDATSITLLERVKPEYGLITGNEEENPDSVNPEIAARLSAYKVEPVYSEGEQLAIDFISDGISIRTEKLEKKQLGRNG